MANTRISDLTASASNLAASDLVPVVQTPNVGPVKMTGLQLAGGLLGSTTFNGATSVGTALSTVAITGTGGQFSCAAATLAVGQNVTISGTLGGTGSITGYSSPTTYTISATNGSTTFTLVNASTGAALTTTAGTPTGLTYVVTSPVVNFTQTWNNSNVTFTGLKFNVTNTASAAGSRLLDLQEGGVSVIRAIDTKAGGDTNGPIRIEVARSVAVPTQFASLSSPGGNATLGCHGATAAFSAYDFNANKTRLLYFAGDTEGWCFPNTGLNFAATDTAGTAAAYIRYGGATGAIQLGAADAAAPAAQTLQVQSVVAGTSNTAGANFTINGSKGTGTGAGGSIIFQVAPAGSSGTAQNSYISPLQVLGTGGITGVDGATANTLALRNGTNAQTFNVYNTYTDASNYERGIVGWSGNVLLIGATQAGTGTRRGVAVGTNVLGSTTGQSEILYLQGGSIRIYTAASGAQSWSFDTSGHFLAGADNTYDIGASATAGHPRNIYVGTTLTLGDAANIVAQTTTGTKIGTATSQKIGFWNATPIVQPTTGVAAATVAATGVGDVVAASTTFDGYTIPQIVKAMRNAGLLA